MIIGDKYYNKKDLITIYEVYKNSLKVKFNNEDKYSYIRKEELNNYRHLIPIGYIISFWVIPNDPDMIKNKLKDLVFIFDPVLDNLLWDHSENCAPTLIKARLTDAILPIDYGERRCMTMMDDDWILAKELDELSEMKRYDYKRVAVYIDTTLKEYSKLLQNTYKIYNDILEKSSKIIIEHYNEYFTPRNNIIDLIKLLSLDNMIDYSLDIMSKKIEKVQNFDSKNEYGLKVFSVEDIEDIIVTYGVEMKDIIIMKYWYDLDINSISMKHMFIRDIITGELYIIVFNSNGISTKALNDAFSFDEQYKLFANMERAN